MDVAPSRAQIEERWLLSKSQYGTFGGDIRIGDLTSNGKMDFLVYRTVDGVSHVSSAPSTSKAKFFGRRDKAESSLRGRDRWRFVISMVMAKPR